MEPFDRLVEEAIPGWLVDCNGMYVEAATAVEVEHFAPNGDIAEGAGPVGHRRAGVARQHGFSDIVHPPGPLAALAEVPSRPASTGWAVRQHGGAPEPRARNLAIGEGRRRTVDYRLAPAAARHIRLEVEARGFPEGLEGHDQHGRTLGADRR